MEHQAKNKNHDGTDKPLPGRQPSAAFEAGLAAVRSMRKNKGE